MGGVSQSMIVANSSWEEGDARRRTSARLTAWSSPPSSRQQAWEAEDAKQNRFGGLVTFGAPDVTCPKVYEAALMKLNPCQVRTKVSAVCQISQRQVVEDFRVPPVRDLMEVVECHQPLLFHIIGFLADTPSDLVNFCVLSSPVVAHQCSHAASAQWKSMFEGRWPTFHRCIDYMGATCWKHVYRDTLQGHLQCTLEVFDREKKLGFAMAAMPGKVHYDQKLDSYIANYISASEVFPEKIPSREEHRLRFCPPSVRQALLQDSPLTSSTGASTEEYNVHYPYKVLEGISDDLQVGQAVELQWKMQLGSPFGWWYGRLEALRCESNRRAVATITFRHFHPDSRWYRLDVTFGDSRMQPCDFGGYTGGLRAVADAQEVGHWMRFFPKEPVVF